MWSLMFERRGRCFNRVLRFRDIGLKYKMSGLTVSHIWKTFCPAFDVLQRPIRTNEKRCELLSFTIYLQHYYWEKNEAVKVYSCQLSTGSAYAPHR